MKTIAILAALVAVALTAAAADSIGPTVTQTITNPPTRRIIQYEVVTTTVVQRKTAPVFVFGKTNWVSSDVVLRETSVTNAVQRGGRPIRP
jgi:hypothetical protein